MIDGGRIVQRGSAADLAATPGSAFVADLVGSVVLAGRAGHPGDAGTPIVLEGGATIFTTDPCGPGEVAVSVHPWEILIEPLWSVACRLGAKPSRREGHLGHAPWKPRSRGPGRRAASGRRGHPAGRRGTAASLRARKSWRSGKLRRHESSSDRRSVELHRSGWTRSPTEIGAEAPDEETVGELLELAATAAHSSERIAAPIACFMAGRDGRPPAELRAAADRVAEAG